MGKRELLKVIEGGESDSVEFKPSLSQAKDIVESVVAFSNSMGGKIIVGISRKGSPLGVKIGKNTIESLTNTITQNTDPRILPKISVEEVKNQKIIVIQVKESLDKLVLAYGRPFKRVGKSTVKMSKDEYERMILEKHKEKLQFDSGVFDKASLDDINIEKVRWFLRKAKDERGLDIDEKMSPKEALIRLKLIRDDTLTNAAILLFGKRPQDFFVQANVRCARFKGSEPSKPFLDMKIFEGNILDQVEKAYTFVLEHTPIAAWIESGEIERKERYLYPPSAIREAVVNAICHRDYLSPGNVQIRIFEDRLEVWNPGDLPPGWTVETLKQKHESIPKNPLIASEFFLIKFIEQWGTGTNDMIQECLKWHLPEPQFEYTGTSIIVTFRRSKLSEAYLKTLGLNNRQLKALEYLKEKGKITNKEYQELCNTAKATATRDLRELVAKKIIVKIGKRGKGAFYKLSQL